MATLITLPTCASKLLEFLYPTVDWTRVGFFSGLPWYTALFNSLSSGGVTQAITLPDPYSNASFRVYLGSNTDFCDPQQLRILVHEAFHIQQFMVGGGYGAGFMRPGFIAYFACMFQHKYEDNPFEIQADAEEDAFYSRYTQPGGVRVCDCSKGEPSYNPAGLEWLAKSPVPLVVKEPTIPSCPSWWAAVLAPLLVAILSGVVILAHIFDQANCSLIKKSSKTCGQWARQIRADCKQHATEAYSACQEWGTELRERCDQYADHGYSQCNSWSTNAASHCCTWWPCSKFCKVLIWVFTQICNGTVWISNVVCVLTVWFAVAVCKVTVWLSRLICIAWSYWVQATCLFWTFMVRLVLFCW